MTMGHYLRSMRQLTDQWTPTNFRDERRQRLYLKDIDCPPEWHEHLRKIISPGLFYFNENVEEHTPKDDDLFMEERPVAPAGDLMSSLPAEMRAQNLMCYIGHEGTYTPAHCEMCATLGHNIMVEASGNENGEKEGSSIWFMTETKDRKVVREYFLSMLGHDVEIEKHFAQINAWKKANFPVYIVEQRPGDFILIPPLAPHQVWNRGTRTMKVAWNRTTVETLDLALHEALPRARLVCRDEQYKNKAIIYFTLKKYYEQLRNAAESQMSLLLGDEVGRDSVRLSQLKKDFKKLLQLFTEILVDEMFSSKEKNVELIPFDSCITCSYCRCNIFNRFLTCPHCVRDLVGGDQDTYDICMECYAMGRSCLCVSGLTWCEQWDWAELIDNYDLWRGMVVYNDGYVDVNLSPPPLEVARMKIDRKSLAQICQEQLRRRPFNDILKPDKEPEPEEEPEVYDEGKPKNKPKRKKKKGDTYKCHTCGHKDYTYRLAFCSNSGCSQAYCFGVLYRAFDMMPQEILQVERWQCPKCRGICNCGYCRKTGNGKPYEPKNTFIGHDTRAVADDRSKEFLVDFRVHNLNWLKAAGDESRNQNSKRIQRLREQADAEKENDQGVVGSLANRASKVDPNATHATPAGEHAPFNDVDNSATQQDATADGLGQLNGASAGNDLAELPDPVGSLFPETNYSDPLGGGERRLGMGYYEEDDSPDKILFNPYEEATAEDFYEEDSDHVKKSLRAAKRRARQEDDDDPDFVIRKSHKKKKVNKTPQPDILQNLDPALLGGDVTMVDGIPEAEPQQAAANPEDHTGQPGSEEGLIDQGRPFDSNVPTLRQSKAISYADTEDVEEFDEVVPIKPKKTTPVPEASKDPLDLAAEAMRVITGAPKEPTTPSGRGRPRGRPPGRPRKSDQGSTRSTPHAAAPTSATPGRGRRRGRPPRSSLAETRISLDDDVSDDHGEAIGELTEELAKEVEDEEDETYAEQKERPVPKRRGRPPKKATAAVATQPINTGRPTRSGDASAPTPASSEKFMSMAERMALRGKKVKIGKQKSGRRSARAVEKPTDSFDGAPAHQPDVSTQEAPAVEEVAANAPMEDLSVDEAPADDPVEDALMEDAPMEDAPMEDAPMDEPGHDVESEPADEDEEEHVTLGPSSVAPYPKTPSLGPSQSRLSSGAPMASKESSSAPIDREFDSREPSPVPLPPKPAGPTIVRLGDSDDESSYYGGNTPSLSGSADDGDSDRSDDDIPAVPVPKATQPGLGGNMAKRGGTRGRGRGLVRGRGRA